MERLRLIMMTEYECYELARKQLDLYHQLVLDAANARAERWRVRHANMLKEIEVLEARLKELEG